MITNKQRKNITRQFNKYSKEYQIFKRELNEFKELSGEELVRTIKGIYYYSKGNASRDTDKAGITKTKRKHFIQTLDIEEINEGMYVYIGDKKYEIIDIEDEANLSLSYILTLEES